MRFLVPGFVTVLMTLFVGEAEGQLLVTSNQTWGADTLIVNDDVIVDGGITLTILPGTVLLFASEKELVIKGALLAEGTESNPITFSGIDSAQWRGITLLFNSLTSKLSYCRVFFGHKSEGGAISIHQKAEITHCEFLYNSADKGGALYVYNDQCKITNCLIARNSAGVGGGVCQEYGYQAQFSNNTIAGNSSPDTGGVWANTPWVNLSNNIIWGNEAPDFKYVKSSSNSPNLYMRHSIVGTSQGLTLGNGYSQDPLFADPVNGDYSLSIGSPAIDQGCHCRLDPDGTRSDMGFKPYLQSIGNLDYHLVDSLVIKTNPVLSTSALPYVVCTDLVVKAGQSLTVEAGVDLLFAEASRLDVYGTLTVAGTLADSVTFHSADTSLYYFVPGQAPRGYGWRGIAAIGTGVVNIQYARIGQLGYAFRPSFDEYDGRLYAKGGGTINLAHAVIQPQSTYSYVLYAVQGTLSARYSKIERLRSPISGTASGNLLYGDHATITFENNLVQNNRIGTFAYGTNSSLQIAGNSIINNYQGALILAYTGSELINIESNLFKGNRGFVYIRSATNLENRSFFRNNIFSHHFGQIHYWLGRPVIAGNLLHHNTFEAIESGNLQNGIVWVEDANPVLVNNTFDANITPGPAVVVNSTNGFRIANNIVAHKPGSIAVGFGDPLPGLGIILESNIYKPQTPNASAIDLDPRFLRTDPPSYQLSPNSPGINSGSSFALPYLLPTDVYGQPRQNGTIDIGAVEFQLTAVELSTVNLSDTTVQKGLISPGMTAATITTSPAFPVGVIAYSLLEEPGLNNSYFSISNENLVLSSPLTNESLLRIHVLAEHPSGAWTDSYFYIIANEVITALEPGPRPVWVYPNPATDAIVLPNAYPGTEFSIQPVAGGARIDGIAPQSLQIDVSGLASGLYILSFTTPDAELKIVRLVILHR